MEINSRAHGKTDPVLEFGFVPRRSLKSLEEIDITLLVLVPNEKLSFKKAHFKVFLKSFYEQQVNVSVYCTIDRQVDTEYLRDIHVYFNQPINILQICPNSLLYKRTLTE